MNSRFIFLLPLLHGCALVTGAGDSEAPRVDDAAILKDLDATSVPRTRRADEGVRPATVSSDAFQKLSPGQSFAAVTHLLGAPLFREPVINRGRSLRAPRNTGWYLIYANAQSDRVFYHLVFSDEDGRPGGLVTADAFVTLDKQTIRVGRLWLGGPDSEPGAARLTQETPVMTDRE